MNPPLKPRQKLGKYRILRRIADGGFARVYRAHDTVEGIDVALKIPHAHLITEGTLVDFRREARITARLEHPNILPLKNADFIDERFVIASPLGEGTLEERLGRRITLTRSLDYADQILAALAYAHSHRVIHCDVKPDNFMLFEPDRLRLGDFGISKVQLQTMMSASGSGTLGYVAPEQAMGRPTYRSDCFSAGLIIYRMLVGELPSWPFNWPLPGNERLRRKVSPAMISFLKRSLMVDEKKRFRDAGQMQAAFARIKPRELSRANSQSSPKKKVQKDWRALRQRAFQRIYGRELGTKHECGRCRRPVSEAMRWCPWCANTRRVHRDDSAFPKQCRRCGRGMKLDWVYCAHCYGASQGPDSDRSYTDKRYTHRCGSCKGDLMPHMRYCPWCRRKVLRKWKLESGGNKCTSCGWDVAGEFWRHCPWCGTGMTHEKARP